MKIEFRALSATALLLSATLPAIAQERQTLPSFSYSEGIKNGDCKIAFSARDGETYVDFGLGTVDSVFAVDVVKKRWDIVDGEDLKAKDTPITLTFQNGQQTTSEFGGYRDDNYQGLWGVWHGKNSDPKQSQSAFEKLMDATSATVSIDGDDLVVVNLGMTGFAANKLLDCAIAEREKRSK
jgi:hypothetical protein